MSVICGGMRVCLSSDRDVREVYKFIELALVLDQAMFDARNTTGSEVVSDAIQIINCVDMYFRTVNTRVSIVYVEMWATGDQMDHTNDIRQALLNFVDYSSRNLYKQAVDATHLITGHHFPSQEVGMAIPDTVCTAKAVGISQDTNVYEPHLVASTVTHMLGHNLGMSHDEGGNCQCQDSWGCIMAPGIMGTNHIQPYHFSSCSLDEYIGALRIGHGICLFNKPGQLEDFRSCGNGIREQDEDCDCGTIEECAKTDPCCDPITCKLRVEADCSSGPCCENCKLRPSGYLCRTPESECDIPEFCNGRSGECPENIYHKNGEECKDGNGFCFHGKCRTSDEQCEYIWGFGAKRSDEKCFAEYNVQGSLSGNCGHDGNDGFVKCRPEHVLCGTLQCQRGTRTPIVVGMEKQYTRTIVSIGGSEYECKVSMGSFSSEFPDIGIVWDGTKCGLSKICVNKTCVPVDNYRDLGTCPTNNIALTCSGHGVCSNVNSCYCDKGYMAPDCSQRVNATEPPTPAPITSAPPPAPVPTDPTKGPKTSFDVAHKDALSTPSLVIVLVSVVGGVFIFFALLATCYRRSTVPKLEPQQPKKHPSRKIPPPAGGPKTEPQEVAASTTLDNRIITFGSMPSYREDKLQEMKRVQRPDEGDADETSTFIELSPNNLSKDGAKWTTAAANAALAAAGGTTNPPDTLTEVERTLKSLSGYHEEILEALHSASSHASPGTDSRRGDTLPRGSGGDLNTDEPLRIRNLEDLLRQLEPGSERMSEPEADRQYLASVGGPYGGCFYGVGGPYASLVRDEEEGSEEAPTYSAPHLLRSASEEALPVVGRAAFSAPSLPSPPSEESGSYEESPFPPPLLPGPPRRARVKKKFPEYKMAPLDHPHRRNYYK